MTLADYVTLLKILTEAGVAITIIVVLAWKGKEWFSPLVSSHDKTVAILAQVNSVNQESFDRRTELLVDAMGNQTSALVEAIQDSHRDLKDHFRCQAGQPGSNGVRPTPPHQCVSAWQKPDPNPLPKETE